MVTSSSARSQEGSAWILHHCKRSQGPLTKKAPSRCWFGSKWPWWIIRKITTAFPCLVDSINVSQPSHKEFQPGLLMDLHGHQHCYQSMFNHYSYWESCSLTLFHQQFSSHTKAVLKLSGCFCPQPVLKKLSRLEKQNSLKCFHLRTAYHLTICHNSTF